jgi:hypothetical protein
MKAVLEYHGRRSVDGWSKMDPLETKMTARHPRYISRGAGPMSECPGLHLAKLLDPIDLCTIR